jgi:glycosyltransferase involved in cell wall biosynthesis
MITFIIPSIGRETLKNSLLSLISQVDDEWECHVGFDGLTKDEVSPDILVDDPRIIYHYFEEKQGRNFAIHPGAGEVRNQLMKLADSDWYAFLDDDDTVSREYVYNFKQHLHKHPLMDMMIFRMRYHTNYGYPHDFTVPQLELDDPYTLGVGQVGISFCVKKEFIERTGVSFATSNLEDLNYVEQFVQNDAYILLSDIVGYFVGGKG